MNLTAIPAYTKKLEYVCIQDTIIWRRDCIFIFLKTSKPPTNRTPYYEKLAASHTQAHPHFMQN